LVSPNNIKIDTTTVNAKEPYFWHDIIKDAPICKDLMANFEGIRSEVLEFLKNPGALWNYPKYNVKYNAVTYDLYSHYWKAAPMSIFEDEYIDGGANPFQLDILYRVIKAGKKACPILNSVIFPLEKDGNLRNCFISRLVPGSIIRPHDGTTDKFMRVHFGLSCDPGCQITVGNETQTWYDGKILAFKDGGPYLHSVKHEGTKERIIVSCDIRIDPYLLPYMNI
jgi:hypothetical protein